ncbi:response regulator [Collinsella vaginalis]|uniref:response regulator n=1 Tax=Collinsella vaginalis TaxID=1870987 RepID=UPI000A270F23|nr:response regulator [Collinsella vaginalis]
MRRLKVLFASSRSDSIDEFVQNLTTLGYDVVPCMRGVTAIQMTREHHFDIAIISIELIGLNGFEICRQLREHFDDSKLPIVLHAPADSEEWRSIAFEAGANSFAFDPINFDRLDSVIGSLAKFKTTYEGLIPVSQALQLMIAVYVDLAQMQEEHGTELHIDIRRYLRYAKALALYHLELTPELQGEFVALNGLLLNIGSHLGSLRATFDYFVQVSDGTDISHIAYELKARAQAQRPLTSEEAVQPKLIEAATLLCQLAMESARSERSISQALMVLDRSARGYDRSVLQALELIIRSDELLDQIFAEGEDGPL